MMRRVRPRGSLCSSRRKEIGTIGEEEIEETRERALDRLVFIGKAKKDESCICIVLQVLKINSFPFSFPYLLPIFPKYIYLLME